MLGAARVTRTILALVAPAQQADVSSTRKASKSFPSRGLQTPLRYSIRQQHPGSLREPARLQFTEARRREDQLAESPWLRNSRLDGDSERLKAKCAMRLFLGQGHGTGMGVERTVKQLHGRHSERAEPVPPCPVYPPAPSWLQRKSLCCSETNSSDPDCFPSRGLKSVGKQTELNRMNLAHPRRRKGLVKKGALGDFGWA